MESRVIGLLLAAGSGRRFRASAGRPAHKLLAAVDGMPVARRAYACLTSACDVVIAVVRPDAPAALLEALEGAVLVVCRDADLGMGHSLAAAAAAATALTPTAVLVMPADMPWVKASTVRGIAQAACAPPSSERPQRIIVPVTPAGERGHPVAFGAALLGRLSSLSGDRGARTLLETSALTALHVDDPGILRDVDIPDDLISP